MSSTGFHVFLLGLAAYDRGCKGGVRLAYGGFIPASAPDAAVVNYRYASIHQRRGHEDDGAAGHGRLTVMAGRLAADWVRSWSTRFRSPSGCAYPRRLFIVGCSRYRTTLPHLHRVSVRRDTAPDARSHYPVTIATK